MKLHEIKLQIAQITGLTVLDADNGVSVLVTGDQPERVKPTIASLKAADIPFNKKRNNKFKGALIIIPLVNVGTVWNADWEYAS